jgi:hypothetical protein
VGLAAAHTGVTEDEMGQPVSADSASRAVERGRSAVEE